MKRIVSILLLALLCLLIPLSSVFASYDYYISVEVENTSESSFSNIPLLATINNDQLADLGYIESSGLDTDFVEGASGRVFSLSDSRLAFYMPSIAGLQTRTYNYRLGEDPPQTVFPVVTGVGGYVTTSDSASMELASSFEIEYDGLVELASSDAFPVVEGHAETAGSSTSVSLDLPTGIEADEILYLIFEAYEIGGDPDLSGGVITGWTVIYNNEGGAGLCVMAYKIAVGTETGTVDFTIDENVYWCGQILRISGAKGSTPEFESTSVGEYWPDPAGLCPSWGMSSPTLWLAVYSGWDASCIAISNPPTGYTTIGDICSASGRSSVGSAYLGMRGSSDNPNAFDLNTAMDFFFGITVAIEGPSSTILSKDGSFFVYTTTNSLDSSISTEMDRGFTTWSDITKILSAYASHAQRFALLFDNNVGIGEISSASFRARKSGSPTGTAYVRARRYSDDEVVGTFGSIDVSTISTTATWYSFTTPVFNPTSQRLRITFEYDTGGDASNYLRLDAWDNASGVPDGELSIYQSSTWSQPNDSPMVIVDFGECYVTTSLSSSEEHLVGVAGDGTDFTLSLDSVEEDSVDQATIKDDSSDWILEGSLFDYYKHTVSSSLKAWYEPNTMILSSTLTDRSGSANHGTITWGTNPSGLVVTVGGLLPYTAYVPPGEEDEDVPEVVPTPGVINPDNTQGATGMGLPLYSRVKDGADAMGWSVPTMYTIWFIIIAVVLGIAGMVAMGSVWGFVALFGATSAMLGSIQDSGGYNVMPLFITVFCVLFAIFVGYIWRYT